MKLDKFSDYALRILIALATAEGGRVPASVIARRYGLSEHHIAKVATQLVRGGFVRSDRGRGGGLSLARAEDEISIGAVLRSLMADDPVVECFGTTTDCVILPACGLRGPLGEAKEAFFAVLDGYSLRDVTGQKRALATLLGQLG